jgi:predicted nicotinamide N-methyase
VELSLLRPPDPEALIDEDAFAEDEFMPYWAELWPSGLALARAMPSELAGLTVVELGCGLGVPALVAAARGARVTAVDWAEAAIELLRENAARNGLDLRAAHADWREFDGDFELALAADVLYEQRNVEPLLELLPRLAAEIWLGEPGRPHAAAFLERAGELWDVDRPAARVYRLTRTVPGGRQAPPGA